MIFIQCHGRLFYLKRKFLTKIMNRVKYILHAKYLFTKGFDTKLLKEGEKTYGRLK